jgi:hypothetical protein
VIELVGAAVDPDEARRAARDILGGRQYRSSPTPRPFRRPLEWIGDRVQGVFDWIGRALDHVPSTVALAIAVAVVALVLGLLVRFVLARRSRPHGRHAAAGWANEVEDPAEL